MRRRLAIAGALLLACMPVLAQHAGHGTQAGAQQQESEHVAPEDPAHAHGAQDHSAHAMPQAPRTPLPEPTAAERAAAFPDLHGMDMRDHMDDDPFVAMLQVDQLEWRDGGDANTVGWDVRGWAGYSFNRAWLRSEGERRDGHTEHGKVELLWGHAFDAWWDVVAGVRHDIGGANPRDWLAIGVQGLAPYKFEVEATAYVGESGRFAAALEVEYDVLLGNRLILQPKATLAAYGRDDIGNRIGEGLSSAEFGLRLRYEFHRQFAPYIGYSWSRNFGRTADFADDAGEPVSPHGWVAGVRFWF